jgi:hypothetical protein
MTLQHYSISKISYKAQPSTSWEEVPGHPGLSYFVASVYSDRASKDDASTFHNGGTPYAYFKFESKLPGGTSMAQWLEKPFTKNDSLKSDVDVLLKNDTGEAMPDPLFLDIPMTMV